jgi:dihydroorotase-like cyclic amidohydrolase
VRAPGVGSNIALTGARVVDPESGLDAVCTVAVADGRIDYIGPDVPAGVDVVDAAGLVLAPGFIDLHSHAQSIVGLRLQALDGVTSALDLEAGRSPVERSLAAAADTGRPINYGFSAGWAATRALLAGASRSEADEIIPSSAGWDEPWGGREVDHLLDALSAEVSAGAVGIGVLLGYAPDVTRAEYLAVARLAADLRVPTFTHTRYIGVDEPNSSLEGMLEVVAAAAGTGAHMHVCHLNSTSNRQIDEIAAVLETARSSGARISTEAYPYGSGATSVGAAFLTPERLGRMGMSPSSITYLRTGRPFKDAAELAAAREDDPNGLVITRWADEDDPADRAVLQRSLLFEDTAIATDSFTPVRDGAEISGDEWPLGGGALTHPRSVGCYAKVFRWLVRDLGALSLPEAVRRCSLVPADILGDAVPVMQKKGRIQVGCDADIVVFDPDRFADQADYSETLPSLGVTHLLVGGKFVIRDGVLDKSALPGRPLRGRSAPSP